MSRAHRVLGSALAVALTAAGWTHARAQTRTDEAPSVVADNSPHDLYLGIDFDDQKTALLAHFRELNGRLSATGNDLNDMGIDTERLGIAGSAEVALDSIPGLQYHYDAAHQIVELHVPEGIRKPYRFSTRVLPDRPPATSSSGLAINYDAFAQSSGGGQFALFSELRYFNSAGVLSNTGTAYWDQNGERYTRYDTSWSTSNPTSLETTQIGDTISSSLAWTRSVRIGGFQWRSNFALRPDLITFPMPTFTGSAAVPSAVEVYINNIRQYSGSVPSGPFIVNDVPGITGSGQATLVTRDALGRTVSTSVPLYVDTRLLAPGLSSYSLEAGFLREAYGLRSFDYDARPALSGSLRRGMSDFLTVEGHAEATSGVYNAGAGALARLGTLGVVNGSVSGSAGRLAGTQASVGYQLIEPYFSVNAQTIRAFGHYGDLAARDGTAVPSATDQITLSLSFVRHQSFAVSYIGFKVPQLPSSRVGTIAYTLDFGSWASLNISAYNDFAQHRSHGAFVTLNLEPGHGISIGAVASRQGNQSSFSANAIRPPEYDGGWGWGVQHAAMGAAPYSRGQVQYLGRAGELTAVAEDAAGRVNASLDLTGAVVLMDHSAQLARRIDDGFALVSTDGVADIPVLHENRVVGTTDRHGHFLIPDLNAYQENLVAIDPTKLPADARIGKTSTQLVPQAKSGVLAHFGVTRYSAASVILVDTGGKPLPPGARVHHEESGKDTVVGFDGVAFIDDLEPQNHLAVEYGAARCVAEFGYERPDNGSLPTIGPLTCRAVNEEPR